MAGSAKIFRRVVLLVAVLPLMGCSLFTMLAPETIQPTGDPSTIRTEAAETIVAEITLQAELNPSQTLTPTRTPPPPTRTPIPPTETIAVPTATETIVVTPSLTFTRTAPIPPTRTATVFINDQARLVDQSPADWTVMPAGRDFDLVWVVKNSGRRAWDTDYTYQYDDGVKGYKGKEYHLKEDVSIGEEIKLTVDMIAPAEPGIYQTRWVMVNSRGVRFATFFLTFISRQQ